MKLSKLRVFRWLRRSADHVNELSRGFSEEDLADPLQTSHSTSRRRSRKDKQKGLRTPAFSVFDHSRRNSFSGVSTASFEFVDPAEMDTTEPATEVPEETTAAPLPNAVAESFIVGSKPAFTGGTADAWMMY